jgi:hypothetical protein
LDLTVSGQGQVAGCCECGDEPSGSCATELVIQKPQISQHEILEGSDSVLGTRSDIAGEQSLNKSIDNKQ